MLMRFGPDPDYREPDDWKIPPIETGPRKPFFTVQTQKEQRPMSYSFSVTADTKAEATGKIREQFDAVVVAQPSHAAGKEAAVVAAQTLVRLLAEPHEGDEICVNMYGSLGWRHDTDPMEFLSASLNINASLRNKSK